MITVNPEDITAIILAQRAWLEKLQEADPTHPIKIKIIEGAKPDGGDYDLYAWKHFRDVWHKVTLPIYTRGILFNEILIDPDSESWQDVREGIGKLHVFCKENNIPHTMGFSGGKGIHFSIIFGKFTNGDKESTKELFAYSEKYNVDADKTVRRALLFEIAKRANVDLEKIGIDEKKINFGFARKGSQVRDFGTIRAAGKYKTLITEIPNEKPEPYELPLVFPEEVEIWNIKGTEYNEIAIDAIKNAIEKEKNADEYTPISDENFKDIPITKFPCIDKLFKAKIRNGRYYAAVATVLMCQKCGIPKDETKKHLTTLCKTFPGITQEETDTRINNALEMHGKEYHFSCTSIKETFPEHNLCNFSQCPIKEKIEETQPDLSYNKCLDETRKLVPEDDEDKRPGQVKDFIKCSNLLKLNVDEATDIVLKICTTMGLPTKWENNIIQFYKRLKKDEAANQNRISNAGQKDEDGSTNGKKLPPVEDRLTEYPEHIIKKANEILDTGDPFLYICDTWNESHVGDRNLGEMLACSITSTQVLNLSVGIHEKPSGDTESGKSSACVKMGNLTPYWKFRSTTFSPKVLYYMKDLLPGTIIYTDDIDFAAPGVVSTIKKVTGEFEDPTISDTIIDGEAVNMFIPPRINFWLSSVDTVSDKQLGTRFVYSNTEGGTEHDREVNHKQKGKALGKPLEEDDEKILICRCMFEYICDQLHYVFSPYLFASSWSSESEKRNYEKFMSVLFALTVFNYRQRETLHGNLLGTLDDWERAISVYAPVAKNNSCLLSDEEILILFSLHEMLETGAFEDGVPHKRLLAYMKDEGRFAKSDATLRRMLIGEIGSGDGKKGFKEKVPGFSHEMVSVPKLDENGLKVTRYTKTLCYSYNDTLFDEITIPAGSDIVKAIKTDTFVVGDNYTAQAVEQLFREDPVKAHSLKKDRATFETWKESLRNHQISSDFTRFHQIAKPMKSGKPSQPLPINNEIVYNNNIRLQESSNNGVDGISVCVVEGEIEEDTCAKLIGPYSEKNANSMKSESPDTDKTLQSGCNPVKSGTVVLKSESPDADKTLQSGCNSVKSGSCILDSVSTDNDNTLDSDNSVSSESSEILGFSQIENSLQSETLSQPITNNNNNNNNNLSDCKKKENTLYPENCVHNPNSKDICVQKQKLSPGFFAQSEQSEQSEAPVIGTFLQSENLTLQSENLTLQSEKSNLQCITEKIQEYIRTECNGSTITKPADTHITDFKKLNPELSKVSRQILEFAFSKILKSTSPLDKTQNKTAHEETVHKSKGISILEKALQAGKKEASV
jgi:hypothetical protein